MPTVKQIRVAEALVENGGNVSRAMLDVGYSPNTAKTPQKLTESKGFKELMDECGLTDSLVLTSLAEDIRKKKGMRAPELRLASDIKGFIKREPEHSTQPINIVLFNGNFHPAQLRSDSETLPIEGVAESVTIQVPQDS